MSDEPQMRTVLVSSVYEETPEGLYHMDRIRMWQDEHDKTMRSIIGPRYDELEQQMTDAFIRGTAS
jgi:hypothetical protein